MSIEQESNQNLEEEIETISSQADQGKLEERQKAIRQLGIIGNTLGIEGKQVFEKLVDLTSSSEAPIREATIESLKNIAGGANYWYPEKLHPSVIPDQERPRWEQRKEKCQRIAEILLPLTKDPDLKVRETALHDLGTLGFAGFLESEIKERCWQAFENEEDFSQIAADELVKMAVQDERLVNNLLSRLETHDPDEKRFVIWGMGRIGNQDCLRPLQRLKKNAEEDENVDSAIDKIKEREQE